MHKKSKWKPLKLRAIDDNDLLIFSECIHEAIFFPSEVNYDYKEKQFAMAVERFTWEYSKGEDFNLM